MFPVGCCGCYSRPLSSCISNGIGDVQQEEGLLCLRGLAVLTDRSQWSANKNNNGIIHLQGLLKCPAQMLSWWVSLEE